MNAQQIDAILADAERFVAPRSSNDGLWEAFEAIKALREAGRFLQQENRRLGSIDQ